VTPEGVPKIVAFGTALALSAAAPNAPAAAGTAAYMSPEQAARGPVDHRTDIWSFGVVLYEALTGARPFDGEPPRTVLKRARANLPGALARSIDRCLQREPDARFQEMRDVVAELRRVQTGLLSGRSGRVLAAARWLPVGLVARVLLGLVYSRMLDRGLPGESIEPLRLAVLPQVDRSAGAEEAHVAEALTEEMIARLSTLEGLEVIGRNSVRGLEEGNHGAVEIAQRVRAGSLLRGTVHTSHDQLAISLQLIEAQGGSALWSRKYRAPANDVQLVHRSIGADVANALRLPPQAAARLRMDRKETNDPEAYAAYLKGRHFSGRRDKESFGRARQSFEQAIDRDPTFARAWAGLAGVYALLGSHSWMPPVEAHRRARRAAEEALNLDDELAEANTVLGSVLADYYWDRIAAERHLRRAIELDPGNALAHQWLSEHLWSVGHSPRVPAWQ
jgi:TolB-like protein